MHSWFTVSPGPGFVSAYVLSSEGWTQVGWVSLWNERSRSSTRPDTAPLPGEPGCVFYQQKSCQSVRIHAHPRTHAHTHRHLHCGCLYTIHSEPLRFSLKDVSLWLLMVFFCLLQVLICQCTCYVAEDQLFQWAEKVTSAEWLF